MLGKHIALILHSLLAAHAKPPVLLASPKLPAVSFTRVASALRPRARSDPYSKDTFTPPGHRPTAVFRRQQLMPAERATSTNYRPPITELTRIDRPPIGTDVGFFQDATIHAQRSFLLPQYMTVVGVTKTFLLEDEIGTGCIECILHLVRYFVVVDRTAQVAQTTGRALWMPSYITRARPFYL